MGGKWLYKYSFLACYFQDLLTRARTTLTLFLSIKYIESFFNLKIPENFMRLILRDEFWIMHILLIRMVKFQFLVQFPVDHLAHPVVSCLILDLRKFAAFTYYAIDRFVSITT